MSDSQSPENSGHNKGSEAVGEPTVSDRVRSKLERTMGLPAALAIGVGTMVGAGIFVFPGLVAESQGASGIFAFLLAGTLALLVAGYTAELSTAVPLSGGSYTVIERYLGRWPGRIVGLAQWAGLLFASAFYLSAFTGYASDIFKRLSLDGESILSHAGPLAAVALTAVIALGGRRAGRLQTVIVLLLTLALTLLFLAGLWKVFGASGTGPSPGHFLPTAPLSLVSTAAMIFTAYIGFVQIAAVGGEIRRPGRNLPLGLVGSVVIVMLLYLLVYFVSIILLGQDELAAGGETAVVAVGTEIAGATGTAVVLGAGLLATLSSANASILSASRTLFALARDGAVPAVFQRAGLGAPSPWVTVLVTGLPCAGLAYFAPKLLAELASFLHLLIYGLICLAIWPARRGRRGRFDPAFQMPGHPAFAVAIGVCCFGLAGFMSGAALAAGAAVISVSLLLLIAYRRLGRHGDRD